MSKYQISQWPVKTPTWTPEIIKILAPSTAVTKPDIVKLENFLKKSDSFPHKFPIDSVCCKTLKGSVVEEVLEYNINSAYPVVHEIVLPLYANFILHKQKYGTSIEKPFYKGMTVLALVERLLTKRAVMFMGKWDSYILIDGTKASGKWDQIGKINTSKLKLEQCLSYDEIKLSVFLSVSSYSYFINNGTRKNMGKVAPSRNSIQNEGVVVGIIGARLKRQRAMEYEEMVITETQNTERNGYGKNSKTSLHGVFADFYEEPCFTHEQVIKQNNLQRFTAIDSNTFFDNVVFSKRIAISIETLLLEANHRASAKKTTAYIHMVGIGLGVWKCSAHQGEVLVETFAERLRELGSNLFAISDVFFSYFSEDTCGGYKTGQIFKIEGHPKNGIRILFGKRDPHIKLSGVDSGKLLIVSYAWDGNALPGNEFWSGKLGSTGDSAAAASTQITELHNPFINPKVCVENLHIATRTGLFPFADYVDNIQKNFYIP